MTEGQDFPIFDGWDRQFPRFLKRNIGNPSAPITTSIFKKCIQPYTALSQINAIGHHTLRCSNHLPELSEAEAEISIFVLRLIGCSAPSNWCGYTCSGANLANLHAMWLAKEEARSRGLKLLVFASEFAHYSFRKAIRLCELPAANILDLSLFYKDSNWENCALLLWLTFGETHRGQFEIIPERFNEIKEDAPLVRCHVDAAYGGLISSMPGIPQLEWDMVDSFVVDFHKTGRLPLTRSFHLVQREWQQAFPYCEAYIPHGLDYTIQGSRPFSDIMEMVAYTRHIGVNGHKDWVMYMSEFTRKVEWLFRSSGTNQISRSANILFIRLPNNSATRVWCARFNVSGVDLGADEFLARIFCWPALNLNLYREFCEGLNGCL